MKYADEYALMQRHSDFLRMSCILGYVRARDLEQTMRDWGFSQMPTTAEDITKIQQETAMEIGGFETRMILDENLEIEKYHFAPLQIGLCLLYAAIENYGRMKNIDSIFSDQSFEEYWHRKEEFIQELKELRDAVLHGYPSNRESYYSFAQLHGDQQEDHSMTLLFSGEAAYREYVNRLDNRLRY